MLPKSRRRPLLRAMMLRMFGRLPLVKYLGNYPHRSSALSSIGLTGANSQWWRPV